MKRILFLLLTILLVFSTVACGKAEISSTATDGSSATNSSVSESEASSIPTDGTTATEGSSVTDGSSTPTESTPTEPVIVYETRYFVTSEEHFGEQPYKETWTYDDMGNVLTHVYTAYFTIVGDNPSYAETFRYDEQGRLIYEDRDGIGRSYNYNDQGLVAVKTNLNKDGSVSAQWTYTYNEKGDVVKEDNGKYGYTFTYVYGETTIIQEQQPFGSWATTEIPVRKTMDLNGNVLKLEEYQGNEWKTQVVWEYDKNGNITYLAAYNGKNIAESYLYDNQNNLLEEFVMDLDGTIYSGKRYTYTEDGKLHTMASYDPSTNDFSKAYMEYIYDERGNIIKYISHAEDGTTSELDVSPPAEWPADVYDDADNLLIDYQGEDTRTEFTYIKLQIPTK